MELMAKQIQRLLDQLKQNETIVETEWQCQRTRLLPSQQQREPWHAIEAHGSGAGDDEQNFAIVNTWPEGERGVNQEWLTCPTACEGQGQPWNECDGQQAWQE